MTESSTATASAFIAKTRSLLKDDYLPKIERCLERLTDEHVWSRPNSHSNSIGNLLLHLSGNVRQWIVCGIGGATDERRRQEEFDQRNIIPTGELLDSLRRTLAEVDEVLDGLDEAKLLEQRVIQTCDVTVLEAIYHVVEHFSMHTGQIILLTKQITGAGMQFYDFEGDTLTRHW